MLARPILLLALVALATPAHAAPCHLLDRPGARVLTPADLREKPVAFPFAPGERLEWGVRYFGIEVGRAAVEVVRFVEVHGRRVAHVVGTARTNAIFSVFYRVDDRSEAWIDADALRTLRTATHTRHGRRREVYEEVEFDWPSHFVRIFEARRHSANAERVEFDFGPFAHDTFDALYALRGMPLKTGDRVRLPVYATQKIYEFEIAVGERAAIRSPVLGRGESGSPTTSGTSPCAQTAGCAAPRACASAACARSWWTTARASRAGRRHAARRDPRLRPCRPPSRAGRSGSRRRRSARCDAAANRRR